MLRKISLLLLVVSSVALAVASAFMIKYLLTCDPVRFIPADLPITMARSGHYIIESTVDEPAPYLVTLCMDANSAWDSSNVFDSLAVHVEPIRLTITVSDKTDPILRTLHQEGHVAISSVSVGDSRIGSYEINTDTVWLDTGKVYLFAIQLDSAPRAIIETPARLQVQMLRAWRKDAYVENYIGYWVRVYGLIASSMLFLASLVFWFWTKNGASEKLHSPN